MEPKTQNLSAVDIQRRVELKEFFIDRDDTLNAQLVDVLFKFATFEQVKEQVLRLHNDLPRNWKTKDRYKKYQKMLAKGVSRKNVKKKMIADGLDPEELGWEAREDRLKRATTFGSKTIKSKESETPSSSRRKFWNKRTNSKLRLMEDLTFDNFEVEQELGHLLKVNSKNDISADLSSEGDSRQRKVSTVRNLKALFGNRYPDKVDSKRDRGSVYSADSVSKDSKGSKDSKIDIEDDIKIDPKHRSQFIFSSTDIDSLRKKKKKTCNKLRTLQEKEIMDLAEDKKIGNIHDYQHFFKGAKSMVHSTSFANIKKNKGLTLFEADVDELLGAAEETEIPQPSPTPRSVNAPKLPPRKTNAPKHRETSFEFMGLASEEVENV